MTFARQHQPEHQNTISKQYELAHKANGGLLAPVGRAWQQLRKANKDLSLHLKDRIHPTPSGTYLSACVLYGTMFGGDVRNFPSKLVIKDVAGNDKVLIDLPATKAQLLRDAAATVVEAQYPKRQPPKKKAGKQ